MPLPVIAHEHKLTQPQQDAFADVAGFFHSDNKVFIIKGYAGTGKTYLIRIIARYLRKLDRQFFLIAPTGRAARILANKSGFTASTIHSLIYGQAKESKEISEGRELLKLKFALRPNQHDSNAVYIIDEASMISDAQSGNEFLSFGSGRLLKDFFRHTGLASEFSHRQVILVGDPAQLPPVQQQQSVALSADYLLENYNLAAGEITLTEVVRHSAESSILEIATSIRNHLVSGNRYASAFSPADPYRISESQMLQKWSDLASANLEEDTILIASTNKQALYYNSLIRRRRYNQSAAPLQGGDRLLVTSNNQLFGLLNGDIIEVIRVLSEPEIFQMQTLQNPELAFAFRDVEIAYRNEYNDICRMECKILENLLYSPAPSITGDEWQAFKNLAVEIHKLALPPKSLKKKNPELFQQMETEYKETLRSSPYLNAVQVKYGFAITCHKSQGGEWNNVFLDFRSFMNQNSEEYFRWAYTAVTRARENIYCLNLPAVRPEYFD